MRGADALVRTLEAADISRIFALSGNQIMPVFDALFGSNIRLIHTRHEAATVYMAEAHAQISGCTGVALVTAGGGLGNALGALIAVQASDTPLLLLSGDSPVVSDGHGAFQEMNQTGLTSGVTKASRRVMFADEMAEAVAWAIDLANSGRNGPVHLALPSDVLKNKTKVSNISVSQPIVKPARLFDLKALQAADRPLIILGPALTETRAPGLAAELCNILHAPVIAMESPRGLKDPVLGHLSQAVTEVDYVLCLGKPVDFTLHFGDSAQ
ncbi:MAG: thiamine pyrophosphate-binding protein, partial [Paracoccaceae bacterium]|nr:thiamine pyrophosphate-binding protein [Paracoccaceae bacterium]